MEGPQYIETKVCDGCDYHDILMERSGEEAVFRHWCLHPTLPVRVMDLYETFRDGFAHSKTREQPCRYISMGPQTPSWCPVLKRKEGE